MSFTSEIKKEIIKIEAEDCCVAAELAAIIRMNGVISTYDPHTMLDVQTESAAIARRIFTLVKQIFPKNIEILVRKKMKLKKNNVYSGRMREDVATLLAQLNIENDDDGCYQTDLMEIYEKDYCKRANLRGAILSSGSI